MTPQPHENASLGHAQPLAEAIPGYSANTANEDSYRVTVALIPSQGGFDTPSFGQASSSTSPSKKCACIVCLGIGIYDSNPRGTYHCRFASCDWIPITGAGKEVFEYTLQYQPVRIQHEKNHYRRDAKIFRPPSSVPFSCPIETCHFSSKRWSDLHRHTTAKHCNNPTKFACSVIGCKYNAEGNGFTRKDKLTDHYKNMHQGQRFQGQAMRAIKPAQASSHADASGSNNIGA